MNNSINKIKTSKDKILTKLNFIKILAITGTILFLGGILITPALATGGYLVNQTNNSSVQNLTTGDYIWQELGTGITGGLNTIQVEAESNGGGNGLGYCGGGNTTLQFALTVNSADNLGAGASYVALTAASVTVSAGTQTGYSNNSSQIYECYTNVNSTTPDYITITLSSTFNFDPTKYYFLYIGDGTNGGASSIKISGNTLGSQTNHFNGNTILSQTRTIDNVYLESNANDGSITGGWTWSEGLTPPVAILGYPTASSTTGLFPYWAVLAQPGGYNLSEDLVGVRYSQSADLAPNDPNAHWTDTTYYSASTTNFYAPTSPLYGYTPIAQTATPLWLPGQGTQTWYANSFIAFPNGTVIATSTTEIFYINGNVPSASGEFTPQTYTQYLSGTTTIASLIAGSTASSSCAFLDIGCEAKTAALYTAQILLFPSSSTTAMLANALGGFKTVFPFSIFFQTIATFSSSTNAISTSTAETLSYTIQFPSQASTTITILDPTTASDIFGFPFVNFWFNIILMVEIIVFVIILMKIVF